MASANRAAGAATKSAENTTHVANRPDRRCHEGEIVTRLRLYATNHTRSATYPPATKPLAVLFLARLNPIHSSTVVTAVPGSITLMPLHSRTTPGPAA